MLTDFKNPLYDTLYTKLSAIASNGFFHQFIRNLPEEHYDSILTPIFKRILRDTAEHSVSKRHNTLTSITLLQELIHCNPKVADFLFQHELHTPPNATTGQDYQKNTVFGVFLSFTTMDNFSGQLLPHLDLSMNEPAKRASVNTSYRKKIHKSIDAFRKLLESLIKLNPQYKRNILDWFYGVIKVNVSIQRDKPQENVYSYGWYCNFLVLLLKLCENMLQDPQKYPTWISKIDLSYIYANPVFERYFLLDGTRVPACPPEKCQESKFSFGTELIFAATFAWFFLSNSFFVFDYLSKKLETMAPSKQTFSFNDNVLLYSRMVAQSRIQLLDPYLMEQVHRLLNFQTLLMLHAYGRNISSPQNLFEHLQSDKKISILKVWPINVCRYLEHFANVTREFLPKSLPDLNLFMNFVLAVIMNKFDTTHDLRTQFLRLIVKLAQYTKLSLADEQIALILKTNPFYEKNLPQALVDFFLDAKEIYTTPQSSTRFDPKRVDPLEALSGVLESVFAGNPNSYLIKYLKDLFLNNQERYLQFINIFMDDIISLVDDLCEKLDQRNQLPEELKKDHQASIELTIAVVRQYHRFAVNLSKHCPEFFLDDIVRDQFAVCLNYSMRVLNVDGFMVIVKKIEASEETPTHGSFIANLVRAYVNLAHSDDFMQSIVNDSENCGVGYFYQMQDWLEGNQILGDGDRKKFSELIATFDLLSQANSE